MQFRLLGTVAVDCDGNAVQLPGGRERCLLCVLLLAEGRPVGVERFINLLWAERPPANARAAIHTYMSRLRRALTMSTASADEARLIRRGDAYLLEVEPEAVDVRRMTRLIERARVCTETAERARLLRTALQLWHGPVAAGIEPNALRERVAGGFDELRLTALRMRIDADLALGQHATVIGELSDLVVEFPFDEELAGQLMLALHRSGRRSDSLDVYRQIRARINDELGLEPGDHLHRLEAAVLRGDPLLGLPGRPGDTPAQLPADVADFVGRAGALRFLDQLVPDGGATFAHAVVISAIAGAGGVGKTALAVHWGHQVAHQFPDGQLYVNLRGWATGAALRPIEALAGFLRGMGAGQQRIPLDVDEAAAMFRSKVANRRMLIVIDNAPDAETVRPLLPGTSGCLVLVTSRDRLVGLTATHGARRLVLDVMSGTESEDLLHRMLAPERLARETEGVAKVASLCAGLPLALRIAAANLIEQPALKISEYAATLGAGDRVERLAIDGDPAASVGAAVWLSNSRLAADHQCLLRWLSLMPAVHFTDESAAAVGDLVSAQAGVILRHLVDVCLLEERAPGRYALHDLIRAFAAEEGHRVDAAAIRAAALDRWYAWNLNLAECAAVLVYPLYERLESQPSATSGRFGDAEQAMSWLDAERPNLIAAIRHAADHGPRRHAWFLAWALRGYFWLCRNIVDWDSAARGALAAAQAEGDLQGQAASHLSLGSLHSTQDDHQPAINHFTVTIDLSRTIGWQLGEAMAASNLGMIYWQAGHLHEAAEHLDQALDLYRTLNRPAGESAVLTKLGTVHSAAGRLTQAAEAYEQALLLAGSPVALAHNHNNLGNAYHALGQLDRCVHHLTTALQLARDSGDRGLEASVQDGLAAALCTYGRPAQATQHANTALAIVRHIGDRWTEAHALNTLATIHYRAGDIIESERQYRASLDLATETGSDAAKTAALVGLADTYAASGRPGEALDFADSAHQLAQRSGYRILAARALTASARIRLVLGDVATAIDHAHRAVADVTSSGHLHARAEALLVLSETMVAVGHDEAASQYRTEASEILAAFLQ